MANKIRIKMGPIEFEAEGDIDLIERERQQFFSLLPQAITAVSPVVSQSDNLVETVTKYKNIENLQDSSKLLVVDSVSDSIKYDSIASFLNSKKFSTDVECVMGVAYFIEIVEKKGAFTSKDIELKLAEARRAKPSNTSQFLNLNIKKGFLKECSEKKEGLKTYSILNDGILWCENYKAEESDGKKKSGRSKAIQNNTNSPLLGIGLDELNLEKYCDITQLTKIDDQILVFMLIYTNEKGIEYFSFNDVASTLKGKFKISVTERQVRYMFNKSGTMFDKKTEKRVVLHKLMQSGIREAQRIVDENKK
ncbi:MAG: hypothetical protein K2P09_01335 [Erysipelotrichales bacterium]|nr:hypothetical protein [Erysipelotrichales bacterium]